MDIDLQKWCFAKVKINAVWFRIEHITIHFSINTGTGRVEPTSTFFRERAPVDETIVSSSISMPGKGVTSEPGQHNSYTTTLPLELCSSNRAENHRDLLGNKSQD